MKSLLETLNDMSNLKRGDKVKLTDSAYKEAVQKSKLINSYDYALSKFAEFGKAATYTVRDYNGSNLNVICPDGSTRGVHYERFELA